MLIVPTTPLGQAPAGRNAYVGLAHISPLRGWRVSLIGRGYKHGAPTELGPTRTSQHLPVAPASAKQGGGLPQQERKAQIVTARSVMHWYLHKSGNALFSRLFSLSS